MINRATMRALKALREQIIAAPREEHVQVARQRDVAVRVAQYASERPAENICR
jgi:hypothetical protein